MVLSSESQPIEHGSTRMGRWLRGRRWRIAFWIAAAEAVVVAFSHYTRWTVAGLWVISLFLYGAIREHRSSVVREGIWIFAAAESFAVIAVIVAFILSWLAFLAVAVFAVIALFLLFRDRG